MWVESVTDCRSWFTPPHETVTCNSRTVEVDDCAQRSACPALLMEARLYTAVATKVVPASVDWGVCVPSGA